MSVTVYTEEQLDAAVKRKEREINVKGELAVKIQKSIEKSGKYKGASLGGGMGLGCIASTSLIIILASIFGALIGYALYKDYDVEIETDPATGKTSVKLELKRA